jgi:hypothetical protein
MLLRHYKSPLRLAVEEAPVTHTLKAGAGSTGRALALTKSGCRRGLDFMPAVVYRSQVGIVGSAESVGVCMLIFGKRPRKAPS